MFTIAQAAAVASSCRVGNDRLLVSVAEVASRYIYSGSVTATYLGAALLALAVTLTISPVAQAQNADNNGVRNGGVGNGNGVGNRVHGAPGPVVGAGLIPVALGYDAYLLFDLTQLVDGPER